MNTLSTKIITMSFKEHTKQVHCPAILQVIIQTTMTEKRKVFM